MSLTPEQFTLALETMANFRRRASYFMFEKIFGADMAEHYWNKFVLDYKFELMAFFNYLDDAYKQVFLNHLITVELPRMEACLHKEEKWFCKECKTDATDECMKKHCVVPIEKKPEADQ